MSTCTSVTITEAPGMYKLLHNGSSLGHRTLLKEILFDGSIDLRERFHVIGEELLQYLCRNMNSQH